MDLETNLDLQSGRKFRQQLINNLTIIQNEDNKDDNLRDRQYKELTRRLEEINTRLDQLEQKKATKDDLETVKSEFLGRIKSIYMGKDSKAIRDIILDMKEKGEI